MICCQSGGFIASGAQTSLSTPQLYLPQGLQITKDEGFGEGESVAVVIITNEISNPQETVQTPIQVPSNVESRLTLGMPIFCRPAKAGEIAERFSHYYLLEGNTCRVVPTYRGNGWCFY